LPQPGQPRRARTACRQVGGGADDVELAALADVVGIADQARKNQALRDADAGLQALTAAHRRQFQSAAQGQVGATHAAENRHHAITGVLDHRALTSLDARGLRTEHFVEHGEKFAWCQLGDQPRGIANVGEHHHRLEQFGLRIVGVPGGRQRAFGNQVGKPGGAVAHLPGRRFHRQQVGERPIESIVVKRLLHDGVDAAEALGPPSHRRHCRAGRSDDQRRTVAGQAPDKVARSERIFLLVAVVHDHHIGHAGSQQRCKQGRIGDLIHRVEAAPPEFRGQQGRCMKIAIHQDDPRAGHCPPAFSRAAGRSGR
jgi:hypothetical protein